MSAGFPPIDLTDRSVLVTGGTGSFGQTFVRHVLATARPRRLIVFSRDEMKQADMAAVLPPEIHPSLRFFIGDVRDRDRLELAMRGVDIVVHAAALKHVTTGEYNPFECIRTNVWGAENVVRAAISSGVERVIALSTDKAAAPVNIYGASKLASDKIFIASNNLSGADGPRFSVVRYGNVVGSRGSVVPLFQRMIAQRAESLPITDARMTRFWITLDHGVGFVLSSLRQMRGGEIFVPKIPSMRITDLASALAPDLPHRIVGIRPGEKLHETMITEDDARTTVELDDRYVVEPPFGWWSERPPSRGRPVPPSFRYSSDGNDRWLTAEELRELCVRAPLDALGHARREGDPLPSGAPLGVPA